MALFNTTTTTLTSVDRCNYVTVVLFSSTLSYHLLAGVLTRRDHTSLDGFTAQLTYTIDVNRGITAVSIAA